MGLFADADNASWIAVAMASIAMIGGAIKLVVDWRSAKDKLEHDIRIAIATQKLERSVESLHDQNRHQAAQIAAHQKAVERCQEEHEKTKEQLGESRKKVDECEEKHERQEKATVELHSKLCQAEMERSAMQKMMSEIHSRILAIEEKKAT